MALKAFKTLCPETTNGARKNRTLLKSKNKRSKFSNKNKSP